MNLKPIFKMAIHSIFTGTILLVAPGSCHQAPVDMGIDGVGLPHDRREQLELKANLENDRKNLQKGDIIWRGPADDTHGLQDAFDAAMRKRR